MTSKTEGWTGFPLSNISGRAQLTIIGGLACSLLVFGFILLLKAPAQAFVTKGTSCSAASCHGVSNTGATISVALNGAQGTSITVAAGTTFEIDWMFTNMVYNATKYDGVNPELAVPTGWTVARGTANSRCGRDHRSASCARGARQEIGGPPDHGSRSGVDRRLAPSPAGTSCAPCSCGP